MAAESPRIEVGTDVLDFTSFPKNPHTLMGDPLQRVVRLLPGSDGAEYPGDPSWHKFVLDEALAVVNMTCPPALHLQLRRSVLRAIQTAPAKCHLLASLIPVRYFPESGTMMDRFFAGLISFLEKNHQFAGQHAMDMDYQQQTLSTTSTQTSNVGRARMGTSRSDRQSKWRKPHSGPKLTSNNHVPPLRDDPKNNPETSSTHKGKRKAEISPGKAVQASFSRKRKSLDAETPTKDSNEETAGMEDPTPSKRKKKKKIKRTTRDPTASPTPTPPPEPRVVIKLEDSSDDEPAHTPQPRKKRLNVYENMYHDAREEIRFLERFLWHGAGISKTDIDASKIRVAAGQTHKRAFEQVCKLPEEKLARRPKTPEQD
ncbi:hypothetical protein CLAIMM_12210 [Cladophialophora immunda]|nr:hypothetical protein CLAIMM_12210 [Cladophialophora immunda]